MAVSSKSTAQQKKLGMIVRQTIAQEMVVQSERNIDLLLGLLTFVGWANYQQRDKPFLSVFTQLMLSLVYELGLNKPVASDVETLRKGTSQQAPRTNEERRIVLGCFYITSVTSSFLGKIEPMGWTAHMDECLEILDKEKTCLNDEALVALVRMQKLVVATLPATESPLTALQLQVLLPTMEDLIANVVAPSNAVLLNLHSAKLDLALPGIISPGQLALKDTEALSLGFQSTLHWLDTFLSIISTEYFGFSFAVFSQLARCLTTLLRLVTLDQHPSWDHVSARATANPLALLDKLIANLQNVKNIAELQNEEGLPQGDVFSRSANILQALQAEWEGNLSNDDQPVYEVQHTSNGHFNNSNRDATFSVVDELDFSALQTLVEDDPIDIDWFLDDLMPQGL